MTSFLHRRATPAARTRSRAEGRRARSTEPRHGMGSIRRGLAVTGAALAGDDRS